MSRATIFIILDAFRWNYLNPEDTPCLVEMAAGGLHAKKLITSAGFTQRSAIFCGTNSDITGNFTMFTFDPDGSPFRFLKGNTEYKTYCRKQWWNYLPDHGRFGQIKCNFAEPFRQKKWHFREWIQQEAKKYAAHAVPAHIPLEILPFIGISEDNRPIFEQGALPMESLFDVCYEQETAFDYLMFPITNCEDDNVLQTTLEHVSGGARFYLLQFSDSDLLCHEHGTSGEMRRKITSEIDRKVAVLKHAFEKAFDTVDFVILGDHGMTDITEEINVSAIIHSAAQKHGLKHGRDYLLFLDSTLARLTILKDNAASFVNNIFQEEPLFTEKGCLITEEVAQRYHIPYPDRRYGDSIWWANPGVLICPDYFHDLASHNKAMHGYDSYHDDMKGFAIVYNKSAIKQKEIPEVRLIDICPTLCDLLGIRYPKHNVGKSIL